MNPDRERFLNLKDKPARLNAEEVAHYLNGSPHDIPILVAKGLLKPLGHPADNTIKFFATITIKELCDDVRWLTRATETIREHWRIKNARKSDDAGQLSSPPITAHTGTANLQRV